MTSLSTYRRPAGWMHFLRGSLLALLLAGLTLPGSRLLAQNNDCAEPVGVQHFTPAAISRLDLVAAGTRDLYAGFSDAAVGDDLSVAHFDGTAWSYLGAPGFGNLDANTRNGPSLIVDQGTPIVTFADDSLGGRASVKFYDGTRWQYLGAPGFSAAAVIDPALAIVPNFGGLIAFHEAGTGAVAYQFDPDDGFFTVGAYPIAPGNNKSFNVVVDSSTGLSYIAYLQEVATQDWRVRVMSFDGVDFTDVGNPQGMFGSFGFGFKDLKLIVFDGQLAIAFSDRDAGDKISVARFDGSQWSVVGTRGFSALDILDPEIAVVDGKFFASYLDYAQAGSTAQFRYFDGSDWVPPCPEATAFGVGLWNSLAASDTELYVGFAQSPDLRATVLAFSANISVSAPLQAIITTPRGTNLGCEKTLILSGSSSTGPSGLTYLWSTGEPDPSIFPQTPGTYTLTVIDSSGNSDATSVTITAIPPTVRIDASTLVLSTAQPMATLTAIHMGGPTRSSVTPSITWSTGEFGDSISVSSAGTYTATVTYLDREPDEPTALCSVEASVTITDSRGSGGTVQAIISTPTGTTLTCENQSLLLDAGSSTGAPNLTYSWTTGATTPSIEVTAPGFYAVVVTDPASGNSDPASVQIDQVLPTITIVASTVDLTLAQPTAMLTAETMNGPANAELGYRWSTGETTKSISATAAGTYTVTIDFIEPDDRFIYCSAQASLTITDSRGAGGNPDCARIVASATELNCQTPNITLDAASSLGSNPGPATYLWSTGSTAAAITITTPGTFAVIVRAPSIGCLDTATIVITQVGGAAPQALIVTPDGNSLDCGSTSVVLDGSDSSGDNPLSYRWSTGATTPIIEVMASGTYILIVTDLVTGCNGSAAVTITGMNPGLLAARFLVSGEVCAGDSLYLFDYSLLEAMAELDLRWNFGDGTISTERDPIHTYTTPGRYTVDLDVSSGGCPPERVTKPIDVVQCLRQSTQAGVVARLIPTLSRGPVMLEVELPEVGELHVSILNSSGQVVLTQHFDARQRFREELVLPGAGYYFVHVRHGFGSTILRAVVVE